MNEKENLEIYVTEKKYDKILNYLIAIVLCTLVLICIIGYNYSVKNYDKIISEIEGMEEKVEYKKVELATKLFDIQEYPEVLCTPSTMQISRKIMANFTNQDESDVEINVLKKNKAYEGLINGTADLIIVPEPMKDEIQLAKNSGVELKSYKIANEGLVFLTNIQNKVNNLSLKQIQKIYTGEEENWSKLNGNNEKIIACQRLEGSETYSGMASLVMNGMEMPEATKENTISDISSLVNVISNYEKNAGTIGYAYYHDVIYDKDVKMLTVNDVQPNYETIKNETYPIKTGYYVVIKKTEENNENIKKIVESILSKRGKKLIEDAGYIATK